MDDFASLVTAIPYTVWVFLFAAGLVRVMLSMFQR